MTCSQVLTSHCWTKFGERIIWHLWHKRGRQPLLPLLQSSNDVTDDGYSARAVEVRFCRLNHRRELRSDATVHWNKVSAWLVELCACFVHSCHSFTKPRAACCSTFIIIVFVFANITRLTRLGNTCEMHTHWTVPVRRLPMMINWLNGKSQSPERTWRWATVGK